MKVAYDELHRLATTLMHNERTGHTLQPTALVNEAVLKLFDRHALDNIPNRACFFWVAARAMRQVLVDHARWRNRVRRGGDFRRVPLDNVIDVLEQDQGIDLTALDEALNRLEARNKRQYDVVMLRFFSGLSIKEVASQLAVSPTTVKDDWRFARGWLHRQLSEST